MISTRAFKYLAKNIFALGLPAALSASLMGLSTATAWSNLTSSKQELFDVNRDSEILAQRLSEAADPNSELMLPTEMLWSSSGGKDIGLQLQEVIYRSANLTGIQVGALTAGAQSESEDWPQTNLDIEVSGSHSAVAAFLVQVSDFRPPISTTFMSVRNLGPDNVSPDDKLSLRLLLWTVERTSQ